MTRKFSSTSIATTLASGITNSTVSITVATGTGAALLNDVTLAAGNVDQFTVALDVDTQNEEIVFVTNITGDTLQVVRGRAGTSAISHTGGASVKHVLTSDDLIYFTAAIQPAVVDAKGDIIAATGADAISRLAVGSNNTVLTADSTTATGLKWSTPSGGTVTSVTAGTGLSGGTITGSGTIAIDSTVATLTGTQTFTNKTLTSPVITTPRTIIGLNAQTSTTYTLVIGDCDKLVRMNNASANTVTIPNGVFSVGDSVNIQQIGTGQTTIANDGTTSFTGAGTKIRVQFGAATIICTGTNTFTVVGDLI